MGSNSEYPIFLKYNLEDFSKQESDLLILRAATKLLVYGDQTRTTNYYSIQHFTCLLLKYSQGNDIQLSLSNLVLQVNTSLSDQAIKIS